jgi:hypothetical protein
LLSLASWISNFFKWMLKALFLTVIFKKRCMLTSPLVLKILNFPLYGLKQVPRAWYDRLSKFLLENDFERGKVDTTLFIKK